MAIKKETRILKSNTFEGWRQKDNEISLHLGDVTEFAALINDKDYTTTASVGDYIFTGSRFEFLNEEPVDSTQGYIILSNNPAIPSSYVVNATVSQTGGFTASIVSVIGTKKLKIKNATGTFNAAQKITVGSDDITAANVSRTISESYPKTIAKVYKNGTEQTQVESDAQGFHVINYQYDITLIGSPTLPSTFTEGATIFQGSNDVVGSATWSGVIYDITATKIRLKSQTSHAAFSHTTLLRVDGNTGSTHQIPAAKIQNGTEVDYSFGTHVELHSTVSAGDVILIDANNVLSAINELQDDIGDVTAIDNATGYTATSAVTGITEIQGDIGDITGLGTTVISTLVGSINEIETAVRGSASNYTLGTTATDLVAAVNEIEGVFDASTNEISAGSNAFTVTSGEFTLDSSGDIILDADGGDIKLKDGGTQYANLAWGSGNNLVIQSGTTTMLTGSGANATFAGNTQINGTLEVDGTAGVDGDLRVGSNKFNVVAASGNTQIDGTLEVDGTLGVDGNFRVGSDKFNVTASSGNTQVDGTFNVDSTTTLNGTTIDGALDLNGNADVSGFMVIHGNSTLGDGTGDDTTISGDLLVSVDATVTGVLDIGTLDTAFSVANRNNVKLALNELHTELGTAVIAGSGTAAAGLSNITAAVNALDAEIGTVASYESGTYGSTTIAGVLTSLQAGVIANDTDIAGNDSDISTINTKLGTITAAGMGTTASTVSTAIAELHGEINTSVSNISSNDTDISALQGNGSSTGRLRLDNTGTQTTAGNITFGGSKTIKIASTATLDIDGTLIVGGAGGGSLTYATAFITIAGAANLEGLEIDRSAITSATISTGEDAKLQWRETKVATGASNSSHRAWQLKGFSNAATPIANTTDVVTFYNAKDLLKTQNAVNGSSEIYGAWTATTDSEGFNLHLNNSGVSANTYGSTSAIPVLTVDAKGRITSATTANVATNLTIAGDTGTSNTVELLSEEFLIKGGTNISTVAGTNKVTVNLDSSISITELDAVTLDISGNSDLAGNLVVHGATTLGDAGGDHTSVSGNLAVAGNLTVAGTLTTTTTSDVAITDKNILLGKGSTTSTASDGTGITFGEYGAAATFNYSHSTGRLTSNKNIQATTFYGALSGAATSLATGQTIGMTGDVAWTSAAFSGTGGVTGTSTIGADKVIESHLKASNTAANGDVLAYNSSTQGFTWTTIGAGTVIGLSGSPRSGTVTLADGGATTITESPTGTFTISSTDTNTTYSGTSPIVVSGTTISHAVSGIAAGTFGETGTEDGSYIKSITVNAQGHVTAISHEDFDDRYVNEVDAVSTSTADAVVRRDASKNFSAGTITAALTGNASTATKISSITNSDIVQLTSAQTLTNKTLTAPALGTPASGTLTNCTFPTLNQNTSGSAGSLSTIPTWNQDTTGNAATVTQNHSDGNGNYPILWRSSGTTYYTDEIYINASTNAITATTFIGNIAWNNVTGKPTYDNYGSWTAADHDGTSYTVTSGDTLQFKEGTGINVDFIADDQLKIENTAPNVTTNLSTTTATTSVTVNSSDGTNASILEATTSRAGVMTNSHHDKLDGIAAGANYGFYEVRGYNSNVGAGYASMVGATASSGILFFQAGGGVVLGEAANFGGTGKDAMTISHSDTSSQTSVNNSGRTYIQDITLDTYGHITDITSATETVVNTNTTYSVGDGGLTQKNFTTTLKSKLDGITAGANVGYVSGNNVSFGTGSFSGAISGTSASFTGDVTAMTSDARLKTFDGKIENALDKVMQLNGYQFHWNDEAKALVGGDIYSNDSQVGVSAQEVEAIMPEVVKPAAINLGNGPDADYKTVQYDKMVPLLIEAIKELKEENNLLRSMVEELKDINS